jgi:thioredoxin reductase (NADPH)
MGPELMKEFRDQTLRFGTVIKSETVAAVDFSVRPFKIFTTGDIYTSDTVIIASGARALLLDLPNEKKLMGYGVSACATCDGFFFRGKQIAVVGGGDTAMEEANFLTKFADKVTIIHRRDSLRASRIMQKRAMDNPKIEFMWNSVVTDVHGEPETGIKGLRLKNTVDGKEWDWDTQGLFLGIGHKPNTEFLQGQVKMDENGYIVTVPGTTKTSVEGVFAAGDVQDHVYRQAVTAAGTGCMAAIEVERYLEAQHAAH